MEEGGAKRIVVIVAVVAVAVLGVFWYWQRSKQRALRSGNVYVKNPAPGSVPSQPPDQTASAPPAATGSAASSQAEESAPATGPASASPAPKPSAGIERSSPHAAPAPIEPLPMTQPRGAIAVPVGDTIARNPPVGLAFAGSGKYQLYRQGDITWRLDTDTGRACIIFATDTQWSRVRVWDSGCGAS